MVVEPSENWKALNWSLDLRWAGNRLLLGESLVRAHVVVEGEKLGNEALKVFLVGDEDMVEQLSPWRPRKTLGESERAPRRA